MTADKPLLLTNGLIRTLEDANPLAEAIALDRGRILAVGSAAEVASATPRNAVRVDLGGRTVLPGLIDAHTHLEGTALHLAHFADCHVPPHSDIPGILCSLREHAGTIPMGEWVIGQGSFMLAEKLAEGRLPTLAEMDEAVPDHPAAIRAGAHITVVNSLALQRWDIDESYEPPVGGYVGRDADGRPTGTLTESGGASTPRSSPPRRQRPQSRRWRNACPDTG